MATLAEGIRVVDADSHMTERHDLFTERAPKGYEDKVPHVEQIDGMDMWVIDGHTFGKAGSGGTIDHDGKKHPFTRLPGRVVGHRRRAPRGVGPGGAAEADGRVRHRRPGDLPERDRHRRAEPRQHGRRTRRSCCCASSSTTTPWPRCRRSRATDSCPMPIMPAWSIDDCVREAQRCAAMGYRGVNMTADPQDSGSPDLGDPAWDPFWEVCAGLQLPVHFHIGASQTSLSYFGTTFWPSQDDYVKPAIGGASLFQNNSRVLLNSAYSGMFDRHPDLKMVSVESGIGWVPFMLEAMDYELEENAPEHAKKLAEAAVGVLPRQLVRHVLVRDRPRRPAAPHRRRRRGQRHVRDRLPAPDVPATRARSPRSRRRSRRSAPRPSAR